MLEKFKEFFRTRREDTSADELLDIVENENGPEIGDAVSHDGLERGYRITEIASKALLTEANEAYVDYFCTFENDLKKVTCWWKELIWLEEDQAWMLPGRLLNEEQKELWREQVGILTGTKVRFGPAPEKHVEARTFLKTIGVLK